MGTVEGQLTATGPTLHIGEGPMYYRLSWTRTSGNLDYFFGIDSLTPPRKPLMLLTGTWAGTVLVQFTTTPDDAASWVAVPGESYTANAAQYINNG